MDTPLFSVIVPIYNVEKYIRQCVDSILSQSCRDFELILVDDGSPDGCPQICEKYALSDPRIRVVHKKNGGLVSARKAGAEIARGRYAVCVDGDDWIKEGYLAAFERVALREDPDIICCGCFAVGQQEQAMPMRYRFGRYDRKEIEREIFPSLIQDQAVRYFRPSVWSKAFRMDIYRPVQMAVDERFKIGEDAAVTIPCVYKASSLYILEDCLYDYRLNLESMTKEKKAFSWDGPEMIADSIRKHVPLEAHDFQQQLDRKLTHELFLVAASQFYRHESYGTVARDVRKNLDRPLYREAVSRARFSGSREASLMSLALRLRLTPLLCLYAKKKM